MDMKLVKRHRAAIIVMNVFVALICIAAIAGYFFGPLFGLKLTVDLSSDDVKSIAGDALSGTNVTVSYPDPDPIDIELNITLTEFAAPLFSGERDEDIRALMNSKSAAIAEQITPVLRVTVQAAAEETLKDTTSQIVTDKTEEIIQDVLPEVSDEETKEIMEEAGITDDYLSQKTDEVMEVINSNNATVDSVSDFAVDTVADVIGKLQATGREEFADLEMDAETEQQVRDIVKDNIGQFVDEETGRIDAQAAIDRILQEIADAMNGAGIASAGSVRPLSASSREASVDEQLTAGLTEYITNLIASPTASTATFIALICIIVLTAISMLSWLYLLIKVFVKGFTMNPAVKLKAPILFLGWLPFLILWIVPTIGLLIIDGMGGLGTLIPSLSMLSGISLASSGIFACAAAALLILLFIPYGIIRRKLRVEMAARVTPQEEAAYISANPALVPQEPVYQERTVSTEAYAAPEGTPAPVETADEAAAEAEDPSEETEQESAPADGGEPDPNGPEEN